jgi:hypothetical protein
VPWAVRGRDTISSGEPKRLAEVAALVRDSTAPDDTVVSDLPLVPLWAERESAAATVDPSAVRIGTGSLDRDQILAAADTAGAAVVGRSFAVVPGLAAGLERRFTRSVEVDGIRIYLDPAER